MSSRAVAATVWVVVAALVLSLGSWLILGMDDDVTPEQRACAEQLHEQFPENSLDDWIQTCRETHPS